MSGSREQWIRERAYALWEADGMPEGRQEEYWLRAERMFKEDREPEPPDMIKQPPL